MAAIDDFKRSEWDFVMDAPCCFACGAYLKDNGGQAAHIIADTKAHRAKFGRWILESRYNKRASCQNCNASAMLEARGDMGKTEFAHGICKKIIEQVHRGEVRIPVDELARIYEMSL